MCVVCSFWILGLGVRIIFIVEVYIPGIYDTVSDDMWWGDLTVIGVLLSKHPPPTVLSNYINIRIWQTVRSLRLAETITR